MVEKSTIVTVLSNEASTSKLASQITSWSFEKILQALERAVISIY